MGREESLSRAIVSVATGTYVRALPRLHAMARASGVPLRVWRDCLPPGCPPHSEIPYAFKAYAMRRVADDDVNTLLWCDASIVAGERPLKDLFEKIEHDGYWIANNGWTNYEWTADSAYPDLFPESQDDWDSAREENKKIPHVVATAFGLSRAHPVGKSILNAYYRLASETKAFCGPWINSEYGIGQSPVVAAREWAAPERVAPCGPNDVRGHRHDQTALSVIAWRLGCKLTSCPEWFAYRGGETDKTCLVADGAY